MDKAYLRKGLATVAVPLPTGMDIHNSKKYEADSVQVTSMENKFVNHFMENVVVIARSNSDVVISK